MKRIISMVLTLTMVLGLMPAAMAASPSLPETVNDLPIRPVNSALSGTITASPDEPEDGSALSETTTVVPDETGKPASSAVTGKLDQVEAGQIEVGPVSPIPGGGKKSEAERLFGEGAMSLADFMKENPTAQVYGLDEDPAAIIEHFAILNGLTALISGSAGPNRAPASSPAAVSDEPMSPGWFKADVKPTGATSANNIETTYNPANKTSTWTAEGYEIDSAWTGPDLSTDNPWWDGLGFLPDVSKGGYPIVKDERDEAATGPVTTYGVSSAEVKTTNDSPMTIRRWGTAGDYLMVSTTTNPADAMVLTSYEVNTPTPVITLHYTPLEYEISYQIDGQNVSNEKLDGIFGKDRPEVTRDQSADFTVTISKGYYGEVTVTGTDTANPPSTSRNAAGKSYNLEGEGNTYDTNWKLGADVEYSFTGNTTEVNTSKNGGGPAFFSLSGDYNTGKATGPVTVNVNLKQRPDGEKDLKMDASLLASVNGITTISGQFTPIYVSSIGYTWEFSFRTAGTGNARYPLQAFYVNGESIQIPTNNKTQNAENAAVTYMSTGEKVEITREYASTNDTKEGYKYTVEITNVFRSLTVTNVTAPGNANAGSQTSKFVKLVQEDADSGKQQPEVALYVGDTWTTIGPGGSALVYNPDKKDTEAHFQYGEGEGEKKNNIRVKLPEGYMWKDLVLVEGKPQNLTKLTAIISGDGFDLFTVDLNRNENDGYYYGALSNPSSDSPTLNTLNTSDTKISISPFEILPVVYRVRYLSGKEAGKYLILSNDDGTNKITVTSLTASPSGMPENDKEERYPNLTGSGTFPVTEAVPALGVTGGEDGKYYEFKYWTPTAGGDPVDRSNGNAASSVAEVSCVQLGTGKTGALSDLQAYIREHGVYENDDAAGEYVCTIDLTAVWAKSEIDSYVHYLTFNSEAYPKLSDDGTVTANEQLDFYWEDTFNNGSKHTRGLTYTVPGIDAKDDTVGVQKDPKELLSYLKDNKNDDDDWFVYDEGTGKNGDETNTFIWKSVHDKEALELWFLSTLGGLDIDIDVMGAIGTEIGTILGGIPVQLTLTLPENDDLGTAGDETAFFESMLVKEQLGEYLVKQGDNYKLKYTLNDRAPDEQDEQLFLKKTGDRTYVAELYLKDGSTDTKSNIYNIKIPMLPRGTKYRVELLYPENNDPNSNGGSLIDGYKVSDIEDYAPTFRKWYNGATSGINGNWLTKASAETTTQIAYGYSNGYNGVGSGIEAYVTHHIPIHIVGDDYTIELQQRTFRPDQSPSSENGINEANIDKITNVQALNYLSYDAKVTNHTDGEQTVYVSISVDGSDEVTGEDPVGFRPLDLVNVGYIGKDDKKSYFKKNDGIIDEFGNVTVPTGTTGPNDDINWYYDTTKHRVVFGPIKLAAGGETPRLLARTAVPAVTTHTTYKARAKVLTGSGIEQTEATVDGKKVWTVTITGEAPQATSTPVEANAFPDWLRILVYAGSNDDAKKKDVIWKNNASIPVTVRIAPGSEYVKGAEQTEENLRKFNEFKYMIFDSDAVRGVTGGTPGYANKDIVKRRDGETGDQTADGKIIDNGRTRVPLTKVGPEDKPTYYEFTVNLGHEQRLVIYDVQDGDQYLIIVPGEGEQRIPYAVYSNKPDNLTIDSSSLFNGEDPKEDPEKLIWITGKIGDTENNKDTAVFRFIPIHDITLTKVVEDGSENDGSDDFTFDAELRLPEITANNPELQYEETLTLDMNSVTFNDTQYKDLKPLSDGLTWKGTVKSTDDGVEFVEATEEEPRKYTATFENVPDGTIYYFKEREANNGTYYTTVEVKETLTLDDKDGRIVPEGYDEERDGPFDSHNLQPVVVQDKEIGDYYADGYDENLQDISKDDNGNLLKDDDGNPYGLYRGHVEVIFTNYAKNDVKISKKVENPIASDKEGASFTFNVTLTLPEGVKFTAEDYSLINFDSDQVTNKSTATDNNSNITTITATVTLTGGWTKNDDEVSFTITDLPVGTTVEVEEVFESGEGSDFTTKVGGDGKLLPAESGEDGSSRAAAVTVKQDKAAKNGYTIAFTNTRALATLTIEKVINDYITGYDMDKEFTFKVTLDGEEQEDVKVTIEDKGNGTWSGSEQISAKAGATYSVIEVLSNLANTNYEPYYSVDGSSPTTTSVEGETIVAGVNEVTVTNRHRTGGLTITKKVEGTVSPEEEFTFDITLTLEDQKEGGVSLNGFGVLVADSDPDEGDTSRWEEVTNGKFTVKIKGADMEPDGSESGVYTYTAKITNVPVGMWYTVVETGPEGYAPAYEGETGTISENVTPEVIVTNYATQDLTVTSATVEGTSSGEPEDWTFTLTLTNPGDVTVSLTANDGKELTKGEGNTYTFKLARSVSDWITIKGLPVGATYTVAANVDEDDYATYYDQGDGEIKKGAKTGEGTIDGAKTVNFKIYAAYELSIEKEVVSSVGNDLSREWTFNVTLTMPAKGLTLDSGYDEALTGKNEEGFNKYTFSSVSIQNGDANAKEYTGLPHGTTYKVTETGNDLGNYKTEVTVGENSTTETATTSGPQTLEDNVTVSFKNTRKYGDLTVTKNFKGKFDEEKSPKFTVTLTDQAGDPVSGTFGADEQGPTTGVKFENDGMATFTATDDGTVDSTSGEWTGSVEIKGLPVGVTYTIAEANKDDYMSVVDYTDPNTISEAGATATITSYSLHNLTISKQVLNGTDSDKKLEWNFTLTLTPPKGLELENIKTDGDVKESEDGYTFTLTDGQSITIEDLPYSTDYKVTEAPAAGLPGYEGSAKTESGTIDTGNNEVVFQNSRATGSLTIINNVDGASLSDKTFTFTVTLKEGPGEDSIAVSGTFGATEQGEGGVEFNGNGEAEVTIKGEGIKTINGLPAGVYYTVTEKDTEHGDYVTVIVDGGPDTISEDGSTVTVTNYSNTLTITRQVNGMPDAPREGTLRQIKVTLTPPQGKSLAHIKFKGQEVEPDSDNTPSTYTFDLGNNGSVIILGLPTGTQYKVFEDGTGEYGYMTVIADDSEGEIGSANATVTVTNYALHTLTVEKKVAGSGGATDAPWTFDVTLTLPVGVSASESYNYTGGTVSGVTDVQKPSDGTIENGKNNTTITPNATTGTTIKTTLTLKHGQSITIEGLPHGTRYEVTEQEADKNGYKTEITGDSPKGSLNSNVSMTFTNTRQSHSVIYHLNGGALTGSEDGEYRDTNTSYVFDTNVVLITGNAAPTREDALFKGWSIQPVEGIDSEIVDGLVETQAQWDTVDGSNKMVANVTFKNEDIHVYAVWAVDYNGNKTADYEENGGYVVVLKQKAGTVSFTKEPIDVQTFDDLTYNVKAWNFSGSAQELQVRVHVGTSAGESERYLHVEKVGDQDFQTLLKDHENDPTISGTGWTYYSESYQDADKRHSIEFTAKNVESGQCAEYTIVTSVPAVNGKTDYDGDAEVTVTGKSDPPNPVPSNEVTAVAFAEWLRVLAYVGSKDEAEDSDWKTGAKIPFTVSIEEDYESLSCVKFTSSSDMGAARGTSGTLKGTSTSDGWTVFDKVEYEGTNKSEPIQLKHGERLVIYGVKGGDQYQVETRTSGALGIPYAVYTNEERTDDPLEDRDNAVMVSGAIHAVTKDASGGEDKQDIAIFRFVPVHNITLTKEVEGGAPANDGYVFDVKFDVPVVNSGYELDNYATLTLDMDSTGFNEGYNGLEPDTGDSRVWSWTGDVTLLGGKNDPTHGVTTEKSITFLLVPDGTTYSFTERPYSGYVTGVKVEETPNIDKEGMTAGQKYPVAKKDRVNSYAGELYRAKVDVTFTNTVAYTLTFDLNGGSADASQGLKFYYLKDDKVNLKELFAKDPTRGGAEFKGWSKTRPSPAVFTTQAQVSGADIIDAVEFEQSDVTVYAVWLEKKAPSAPGTSPSTPSTPSGSTPGGGYSDSSDDSDSTYPPSIPGASHGSVSTSPRNPQQGDTVTVTPTPDPGYEVGGVTVKDSRGRALDVKDNGNGTYSFTQPGSRATINVTFVPAAGAPSTAFSDVSSSDYYYEAVRWAVENGVTYGVDNTHFGPALGCTRAQFVTFLWRAAGSPRPAGAESRFGDVSRTAHAGYYDAILWAVEQGVTAGTGDGSIFSPDAVVTRAQSVTFMSRYANKAGIASKPGTASFDDVSNEGAMASYYGAISWAVANGITAGNSTTANTFGPMDDCNRGMMITFLYRLFTGNT